MNENLYNKNVRNEICGINSKIRLENGQVVPVINFDNAATTPPFNCVIKILNKFAPFYSSIHRGTGFKSNISTNLYEISRKIILKFVNSDEKYNSVIYTKNTTESINMLSNVLYNIRDNKDIILSTCMEHHSNDLPWRKFNVKYVNIDQYGKLCLDDLENKLIKYKNRIKLVTVAGASNVTGYINEIYKIAILAHKYGTKILVDGAQLIPHVPFDMKPITSPKHIDFLAFSAHKMYAPFGIGVLIGPRQVFENTLPDYKGGGTVKVVTSDQVIYDSTPNKNEAGTPNIMGAIALCESIALLNKIGMKKIYTHEKNLINYLISNMCKIKDIKIYSSTDLNIDRVSIVPFNIKGIEHDMTGNILSREFGISVRSGCFCAQPYVQRLLKASPHEIEESIKNPNKKRRGMVRISLGLYNNYYELDKFLNSLNCIVNNKNYFIRKYTNL